MTANAVPLPPVDALVKTTACDYCVVGCGYKAYIWPLGEEGGRLASENALGIDYPAGPLSGKWVSPQMHTVVPVDGVMSNVIVIPDGDSDVVNVGGDHSIRGGTLAQKLYSPEKPTADRLKMPMLRTRGALQPIPWSVAIPLVARLSQYVLDEFDETAWAMKTYSYEYYENTYALTKFALGAIGTPAFAFHDKPNAGSDTPGLSDAGLNAFNASYEDWKNSEVIFMQGVEPYETKSILFGDWIRPGGAKIIFVNPRRTFTAAYAESTGGIHLQLIPGTDTVLNNALSRHIIEQGWHDAEFIAARTVSEADLALETGWRRQMFGRTFEQYRDWLLDDDTYTLASAAAITGVPVEKLQAAAALLAQPSAAGTRPKTSVMFEKGNYWTHNYVNTASVAALGLTLGAGGRPGQIMGRAGGHQRGTIKGASYPLAKSPDEYQGNKIELHLDRWAAEGNLRFAWVVGSTWPNAMAASQHIREILWKQTRTIGPDVTGHTVDGAFDALKAKIDAGGLVFVQQEIYLNDASAFADIILPAATWGEADFTRMQGERRLRLYSRIVDAPGEAIPDWKIVSLVAREMGFEGFAWNNANEVFEEAAAWSEGGGHAYQALVDKAHTEGTTGHEYLRALGTHGIQCPISRGDDGKLIETRRIHDEKFSTTSGRAIFPRGDWGLVSKFQERIAPKGDEVWVSNFRANRLWQTGFDDVRKPYVIKRFPMNWIEISPGDAAARGIENSDLVEIVNDDVLTQTGGISSGSVTAVAYITDIVMDGVTALYFNYPGSPANSVAPGLPEPINNQYGYKLGKGRLRRLGPSEFAESMSFAPRNLA
ncbi:MAG TPA: arsenate reductase (azurin) large subunit [Chloroflexota bacterium]|nr:arsenate reductase (azurin) large subunit [Chloroflexota bacterium]